MTDFSDLLNDDFNITESLFDDLIQDIQADTTNYQSLNQEGLNFPGNFILFSALLSFLFIQIY
jgi:hypothetical protein